ncbi:MAG: protoheme IX farnesyltransferase [Chloroflexi bacterium]|nr:protoheme IX farnesyltransferase [Chloroflexota bacterium]
MLDLRSLAVFSLARPSSLARVFSDYLTLVKPPIILLLVVTALGAMFLAAHGVPPLSLMLLVCLGGALGAGGANSLNHYLDRDIDEMMPRTRQRPLPGNRMPPHNALVFGILLNIVAFVVLATWVNLLAAALTLTATLFYVFVYTIWLKRTTPQNIVIGGAAGAFPPLIGWAAITGGLDLPALYLFAIIFFWTPPHFWALALLIQRDYERAGVPMLPVVATREYTVQNIFLYSIVLVTISLVFAVTDAVGWFYVSAAAPLGTIFVGMAWQLNRDSTARRARRLYLYSLLYLALLFVAAMVDSIIQS